MTFLTTSGYYKDTSIIYIHITVLYLCATDGCNPDTFDTSNAGYQKRRQLYCNEVDGQPIKTVEILIWMAFLRAMFLFFR